MRWGIIRVQEQLALVFPYLDPAEGPSAKGALLTSLQATPDDVVVAVQRPNVTVRLERPEQVRALDEEERARLGLPDAPPWVAQFTVARERPWREDGFFQRRLHPPGGDEVQVLCFFGTRREHVWVRLLRATKTEGLYEAVMLTPSRLQPALHEGATVQVRGAPGLQEPLWWSPELAAKNAEWRAACERCGFDVLVREPPEGVDRFKARCQACLGLQRVERRDRQTLPVGAWLLLLAPVLLGLAVLAWVFWS